MFSCLAQAKRESQTNRGKAYCDDFSLRDLMADKEHGGVVMTAERGQVPPCWHTAASHHPSIAYQNIQCTIHVQYYIWSCVKDGTESKNEFYDNIYY